MNGKVIFLVYGWDVYEYPYDPIKAFASEARANEFLNVISDYQATRPESPSDDASQGEVDAWFNDLQAWREKHPVKDKDHRDGFSVMPLELQP